MPLRPVISTTGSAMYEVSKYLAEVLKNLCGKTEFTVRNSADFVRCLSDVKS